MRNLNEYISNDMKSFKTSLEESLLDDGDSIVKNVDKDIKQGIKRFLKETYSKGISKCKISRHPDADGKYIVDCKGTLVGKSGLKSITNGMFKFGEVKEHFSIAFCKDLTSLEGAPERVCGHFYCTSCDNLTSLKGAPKEVGGNFACCFNTNLISLVGAPKEVGGNFDCSFCDSLTSLKGSPKKVNGSFLCKFDDSLTSLAGGPEYVGGDFDCEHCNKLTSIDDKPKHIGGTIKA